jgi:hypothetical protein
VVGLGRRRTGRRQAGVEQSGYGGGGPVGNAKVEMPHGRACEDGRGRVGRRQAARSSGAPASGR